MTVHGEGRAGRPHRGPGWRVWVGAASIFILGAASGILFDRWHTPGSHVAQDFDSHHAAALSHLQDQLHMDPDQAEAVDSALRRHQVFVDDAWSRLRPEVQEAIDSVHAHIRTVLRPDQIEAFHRLISEQEERHEIRPR